MDSKTSDEKLKAIEIMIASPYDLCDGCEAKACYGALCPICEETTKKLREIING